MLGKTFANESLKYSYFFSRKWASTFYATGDNLHEMSEPIFRENKKHIFQLSFTEFTQRVVQVNIFWIDIYFYSSSDARLAFQKQLNYKWEQLNPNLVRVHIPTLPYEAFDCYGKSVQCDFHIPAAGAIYVLQEREAYYKKVLVT